MDVCAVHVASGNSCVVEVHPDETVLTLKRKILKACRDNRSQSSYAAHQSDAECGRTILRVKDTNTDLGDNDTRIALTNLEQGDVVELVRVTANVKGPCVYPYPKQAVKIKLAPCGRLCAVVHYGNIVTLWDTERGSLISEMTATPDHTLAFSPCSAWLAIGSESVRVVSVETGVQISAFEGHTAPVQSVGWSPCGRYVVSGSDDSTVGVWGVNEPRRDMLRGHRGRVFGITVARERIVSGGVDKSIRVWDLASTEMMRVMRRHETAVRDVKVTRDETYLISCAADAQVIVWDFDSGALVHILTGHSDGVSNVAVSCTADLIASFDYTHEVRLWAPSSGACLGIIPAPREESQTFYFGVALSPCGRWVFVSRADGVHILPAEMDDCSSESQ